MRIIKQRFVLTVCFLFALRVPAAVLYVGLNSPNPTPPYTDWSTAATNIQDAIDVSTNGDQVLVTNGIYQTGGRVVYGALTNRVVINKAIIVQSVNGPTVTWIKGNSVIGVSAVRCVYMTNSSTLSGFTVTNGGTLNTGDIYQEMSGGGIWATNNIDVIITNCTLTGNAAYSFGGGVYSGNIISTLIAQNSAYDGGGLANSMVTNSLIMSNSASAYGGGTWSGTLKNCKVISNSGTYGGGTYSGSLYGCLVVSNQAFATGGGVESASFLNNCTVVGNRSNVGAGGVDGASTTANNIIYNNTTPNYSGTGLMNTCCTFPMPSGGTGNITNDPGFVNSTAGDFHLASNSPCINGGSSSPLATDLDGNLRMVDGFVDIGAYEYPNSTFLLPYSFAQRYGLSLDGTIDSDGDGMNNWQEAVAATNPTNATSLLMILSVTNSVSGLAVKWQSVIAKSYYLQRSANLASPLAFLTIRTNLQAFGSTVTSTDATATNGGPYYYRVGVQ
jgi:hypothetical protein